MTRNAIVAFACALSLSAYAIADGAKRAIHIPSGDLAAALDLLAKQSGSDLVYRPDQVRGFRTDGVDGELSVEEAVAKLLEGTPLTLSTDSTGAMLIALPAARAPGEAPPISAHSPEAKSLWSHFQHSDRGARFAYQQDVQGGDDRAAADQPVEGSTRSHSGVELEEVLVVNARNPQQTLTQGAITRSETGAIPFKVISREEILRTGATTAAELLRQLPQNFQRASLVQLGAISGNTRENAVDLRGFGTGQTVTLINDRRLGTTEGGGANTAAIPLAAVDRVEVLSGASSAIYGANALGGVVNYILRNDFTGAEVSAYLSNTTSSDAAERGVSMIYGKNLLANRLNLLLSAEAAKGDALTQADRGYIDRRMERILATNPNAIFGAPPLPDVPANIRVTSGTLGIPGSNATFASVPAGATGANTGPAAYQSTAGQYNLARDYGFTSRSTYLKTPSESFKSFGQAVYALNDNLAVFGEFLYVRALLPESPNLGGISTTAANVPATNPHNPFGRTVQVAITPIDFEPRVSADNSSKRYVAGVKGAFGETWKWSADFARWDETSSFFTSGRPNTATFAAALASSNPATAYNPFADLRVSRPNPESVLAPLRQTLWSDIESDQDTIGLRAAGGLFEAGGIAVRGSFGYEYRKFEGGQTFLTETNGVTVPSVFSPFNRTVNAGFMELSVPLIEAEDGIPLVSGLQIEGAYRYESFRGYDEKGRNGLLGLKWELYPGIALRGTVGTGFFPPTTAQLTPSPQGPIPIPPNLRQDPRRNNEFINGAQAISGGNPDLEPEGADYFSYGLVLAPPRWDGFQLTVDFYRLDKEDAIVTVNDLTIVQNEALFPGRVTRGPNLPGDPPGVPGPITFIDARSANAARLDTSGVDVSLQARLPWQQLGTWTARAEYNRVMDFDRQAIAGQPPVDLLGRPLAGGVMESNGLAGITWVRGALSADVSARYLHSYHSTNPVVEGPEIPSSTEINLLLTYAVPDHGADQGGWGWLSGTVWSLGVRNLTDEVPGFEITNGYSLYNDPRQRWAFLRATKGF